MVEKGYPHPQSFRPLPLSPPTVTCRLNWAFPPLASLPLKSFDGLFRLPSGPLPVTAEARLPSCLLLSLIGWQFPRPYTSPWSEAMPLNIRRLRLSFSSCREPTRASMHRAQSRSFCLPSAIVLCHVGRAERKGRGKGAGLRKRWRIASYGESVLCTLEVCSVACCAAVDIAFMLDSNERQLSIFLKKLF